MRRSRTMEESTTMSSTGQGLVQKIFFPSYLDAGFDESFTSSTSLKKSASRSNTPNGSSVVLDRSITESVGSEASTAIRDNRSNSSMLVANRKKKHSQPQAMILHGHKPNPPSFFSSTKPTVPPAVQATPETENQHTHPHHPFLPIPPSPVSDPPPLMAPTSPPKVARTHSSRNVPTPSRFPFDNSNNSNGANDSLESFKDASSIAIVSSLNERHPINFANENKDDNGIESDSSSCLSHPPPTTRSMFDDTTDDYDDLNQQESQALWEEEAAPAQTAFGKRLLFQRVLRRQNSGDTDDVLSTASENGSLVGYDQSAGNSTGRCDHDVDRNRHDASQESGGSAESSQYATPLQDEYSAPLWVDKTLNMPNLEVPAESVYGDQKPLVPTDMVSQDDDLEEKKVPYVDEGVAKHSSGSATGLLSMAIRRLGSGLTKTNYNGNNNPIRNKCMSAPTTPRASSFGPNYFFNDPVMTHPKQQLPLPARRAIPTKVSSTLSQSGQQQESGLFPSSFLLRSPGSLVFQQATRDSDNRTAQGNPTSSQNHCKTIFNKISENEEAARDDNASRLRPSNSAFQIARSCFSFDAYDTSVNEHYDIDIPNYDLAELMVQHPPNELQERDSGKLLHQKLSTSRPHLQTSASWDLGYSPDGRKPHRDFVAPFHHQRARGAFRPRSSHTRVPYLNTNQPTTSCSASPSRKGTREHMTNEYSPSSVFGANVASNNTQELKSPQRIEIERDDALDILACLVERGVSWRQEDVSKREEKIANSENSSVTTAGQGSTSIVETDRHSPSTSDISAVVKELQDLSLAEEKLGDFHNNSEAHQKRKLALEELLRSHEYALEMKRASQSASSWLKSIGRSQSSSPTKSLSPARNVILSEETSVTDSPAQIETSETETSSTSRQAAGEESSASDSIDLLTAKAMLHSVQMEVREKSELADRLNEELAKCRAEIGRLKSSAQASTSFRSPNRSILDESDDISVTEGDEEDEVEDEVHALDRVVDESDCVLDSSFLREGDCADETKVAKLKTALDEANSVIRTLYAALNGIGADLECTSALKERIEAASRNHPHVNFEGVKSDDVMEVNSVSEWIDLELPLDHPPDHGLRSPIVAAVLEAWTNDPNLHESLLIWFDGVLGGEDSDSIPPLTLSSLEPQVRDGFVLHLLPMLCRRPDLQIDVRTRSQRATTYDLSISIDGAKHVETSKLMHGILQQPETTSIMSDIGLGTMASTNHLNTADQAQRSVHLERYSHLNSLEDISPMARDHMDSRLSYDEMTEEISSLDEAQSGIMSALGGALGGLLSRRKGALANFDTNGPQGSMQTILESPASVGLVHEIVGLVSEMDGDDQPYHRVVSAPPGRIGVTFVEYRGHCMVSDVHPDSPLVSWIFPSDVLIAVDNLPVSGMKVRDIVKVLQDRTLTQRALRVISSHAMSEFTLNASVVADEAG